ncbi:hypothetical protein M407DRAFT_29093 [Tulasnella calospora MUT 4182]|uniref:Uncharacterized protein n=1 Tax=Tulasnella calospora MUT 4182 TaxID=1051891 RepID=A0A0C3KIJ7_9AGAM|nr:hypothetical protein M407DRAFT_29093 [Tulasnella calospora MUT 4182]
MSASTDIVDHVLESQFNQSRLKQYGSSLHLQTEILLQLCRNNILEDGTATISLAVFHKHYESHPSSGCSTDKAKSLFKVAFNKRIIILELLAEVELFLKRTQADKAKASLRISSSEPAPLHKRSRTPTSTMSAMPVSPSTKTPCSTQPSSSKARAVSLPGPFWATPGYTSIRFWQLVPQVCWSALDIVSCSLIDNSSDVDEVEYLKAEICSREELMRSSMKQVFEVLLRIGSWGSVSKPWEW